MPGKAAAGLQGGYRGPAELLHGGAVICGVQLDDLLPPWGGQGMRVPSRDFGFQVLEMVSLEVPAKQSCMMWQKSSITCSEAPLIQERTDSWFPGWFYPWSRISPFPISFSLRNSECCPVTLPGAAGCAEEAGDG